MSGASDISDEDLSARWDLVTDAVAATQRRLLAQIERTGLPGQWFEVLRLLLHSTERRLPMSAIARHLGMTAGGVTKLADRMAREELIDRRNSSGDRRVVYAALTPKGMRLAKSSATLYQSALREHVLDVLSASSLNAVTDAAARLREAHIAHAEAVPAVAEHVLIERDPALPDRRRRGRQS